METTITILKENAPIATMLLLAVLFIQNDLGGDIQTLRAEMTAGFQTIRVEMAAGDQAIRTELAQEFKAVRSEISALGERLARVETRLEGIEVRRGNE